VEVGDAVAPELAVVAGAAVVVEVAITVVVVAGAAVVVVAAVPDPQPMPPTPSAAAVTQTTMSKHTLVHRTPHIPKKPEVRKKAGTSIAYRQARLEATG
jgi:hypothetical protein